MFNGDKVTVVGALQNMNQLQENWGMFNDDNVKIFGALQNMNQLQENWGMFNGDKVTVVGLQNLNFSDWLHKAENTIKTDFSNVSAAMKSDMQKFEAKATATEKQWLLKANAAAKKVGPAFKVVGKDMLWAGGKAWQGVEWCYHTAPCKAAVEKYGMMAV